MQLFNDRNIRKSSRNGQYSMCCPFCQSRKGTPDLEFKLGFNVLKNSYNCFRCGSHGNLKELSKILPTIAYQETESLSELRTRIQSLFPSAPPKNERILLDDISWPLSKEVTPIAYRYVLGRGFTDAEIYQFNLRVGRQGKWSGRLLFPFMEGAECVYLVGRSINGGEPRYVNSVGRKSDYVYNIDAVQGECIICEGIISAIAAERATGVPAVALLGKSISDHQLTKIRNRCSKVWLSLDGDVEPELRNKIIARLNKVGLNVLEVNLPFGKDPDDLKNEYERYFQESETIRYASFSRHRQAQLGGG